MSKLVLRNVSRTFGNFTAVDDLNLTLQEGELVSLLGPSGCGKTTTLRMIAGFIPPDLGHHRGRRRGRVLARGRACRPRSAKMSMIFQSYAIWPNMTVAENVAFGLKLQEDRPRRDPPARRARCSRSCNWAPLRDRYPAELSAAASSSASSLARAIVVKPAVLLLDEPLSNLDANLREEMRFEIRRLHDEFRITTVYVTHDQAEAMVTSDRIAVMNKGRVEQVDAPYEIYRRPKTRFVAAFIGRTNILEGRNDGKLVHFDGFSMPADALHADGDLTPDVHVSVRPQSIHLHKERPVDAGGRCCVPASVQRRAYLGEYWDYHVTLQGATTPLRVTARPQEVFEVGEPLHVEIDTTQLTVIR